MRCVPMFENIYQVESRRLVLTVGILFIVVLLFQSSSLPYGGVLVSLFNFGSVKVEQSTLVHNLSSSNSPGPLGLSDTVKGIDIENQLAKEKETKRSPDSDENPYKEPVDLDNGAVIEHAPITDNSYVLPEAKESKQGYSVEENQKSVNEGSSLNLGNVSSAETGFAPQPIVSSSISVAANLIFSNQSGVNSSKTHLSSMPNNATKQLSKVETAVPLQPNLVNSDDKSAITSETLPKQKRRPPPTSISKMASLLRQSRVASRAMKPWWPSARDQELVLVKSQVVNAPGVKSDPELYSPLYQNVSMFKRSYELMENTFKVYIYEEGENPIYHQPRLKGIYASEGWFMKLIEGNKQFVVKDPTKAHLFYLPFSSHMLRLTLYATHQNHKRLVTHQDHLSLAELLNNYVNLILGKYHFWNRTGGADHFLVACHDWAPQETAKYMGTCIRALCNSDVTIGFKIGKDVSLPVTYVRFEDDPLRSLGGKPPSKRPFLAFFAGSMHGYVRPILLQYWQNKDPDMKIFGRLPDDAKPSYMQYMKSSKYCICARGYEVHTPRLVEAILHGCVPVIISDNYVPPFFEVLNWEAFSVFILENDIPNLKTILSSISKKRYLELQMRVRKVQKHFLWHKNPVKYDIFHMTLHSIWYNRVFQINSR